MPERLDDYLRRILSVEPPSGSLSAQPTPTEELVQAQVVEVPLVPISGVLPRNQSFAPSQTQLGGVLESTVTKATSAMLSEVRPLVAEGHRRLPIQEAGETPIVEDTTAPAHLTGADVAQLLRSPQRLREAILVSEILRRPIDW